MNSKLEQAEDRFIDSIGKLCDSFGLNRFVAQLYAILYLSDKPVSLDDMVERLKVSKGNVSVNIRELEKLGAAKKIWIKGSRKDFYEANLDIRRIILNKVHSAAERRINEVDEMLSEFKAIIHSADGELTGDERQVIKVYEERIKKVEELKALGKNALGLAEKLL